ncbi:L protein [Varroa jacobsoni rhabdovirus 2]|nr:L protein [Varroa jacobsoni rhabdovirus 2]
MGLLKRSSVLLAICQRRVKGDLEKNTNSKRLHDHNCHSQYLEGLEALFSLLHDSYLSQRERSDNHEAITAMVSHREVTQDDLEDSSQRGKVRVNRRQLGSPLIKSKLIGLKASIQGETNIPSLRVQELDEIKRIARMSRELVLSLYSGKKWRWDHHVFLGEILQAQTYGRIAALFNLREILKISETIVSEVSQGCSLSYPVVGWDLLNEYEEEFKWACAWDWVTHLRALPGQLNQFSQPGRSDVELPFGALTFHLIEQWVLVRWKNDVIIYDENTFLMTADVIRGKWTCLLTTILDYPRKEEISLNKHELMFFYKWGGNLLAEHGEDSYKVFKEIEAVSTEVLRYGFKKTPDPFANNTFFPSVVESLPDEWMREGLRVLYDFLMPLSPQKVSEIFGLFRSFGHPYVSGIEGVQALKKLTTLLKVIDHSSVRRTHRVFRRCYCMSYITRYNSWPALKHPPVPGQYLYICYRQNTLPNLADTRYQESEWDTIRFDQNAYIPEKMSISDLLDDKSISPPRSEVINQLRKTGYAGPRTSRSLIEQALDSEFPTPRAFLETIEKNGFSLEDEIMILTCKERELKFPAARMFGQQTLNCRLVTVLGEHLVKEHILPHFRQVTMTYSASQLKNLMARMSRSLGVRRQSIDVLINIDFSKWNSNFRDPLVRPFFQDMDDILGFPGGVLSRTHNHFAHSLMIYTGEGHDITFSGEKLNLSQSWFIGNLGGVEGLRQKPWTVITVCKITEVAERLKIPFENIGQGDNQVIRLRIPFHSHHGSEEDKERAENEARRRLILFLDTLEKEFKSIGLPLKIDETWTSARLFAYGKHLILEGVYLPMVLKRIFRANGGGNDIFPTMSEDIASIFSNCGSAAESSYYAQVPYFIAVFQASITVLKYFKFSPVSGGSLESAIISRKYYRLNHEHTPITLPAITKGNLFTLDVARSIFTLTRALGGLPVQTLPEFLIKGHPDPATNAIALLGQLEKRFHFQVYRNLLNLPISEIIREKMLIQDPLSLNLLAPESCESAIKQCSEDYLLYRGAKNPEFDEILKASQYQADQLKTELFKVSPMFPALLHEVSTSCAEGHIERIKGKVSRMRTLASKAVSLSTYSLFKTMKRCEELSILYHILCISNHDRGHLAEFSATEEFFCSKRYTQYLRTIGWRRDDIIGTTVPSPLESLGPLQVPEERPSDDALALTVHKYINQIQSDLFRRMGPKIPYTGSTTREKQSVSEGMRTYDLSSLVAPCADLVRLIGFVTTENGPMAELIRNALKSVTDAPSGIFETNSEQATGSSFHRMRSKVLTKTGRIGVLPHLFSFVDVHSDKIITGGRGSENTDLVFSTHFIWSMIKVVDKIYKGEPLGRGYDCRIICPHCIDIIHGDVIEGNPEAAMITFRSWPENPYLYQDFSTYKLKVGRTGLAPTYLTVKIHGDQIKTFYPNVERFSSVHYLWELLRQAPTELDEYEYGSDFKISWLNRVEASDIFLGLWEGVLRWVTYRLLLRGDNPFSKRGILRELNVISSEALGRLRPLISDADSVDQLLRDGIPVQLQRSTRLTREEAGKALKEAFFLHLDSIPAHDGLIRDEVLQMWNNIPILYEGLPSTVVMTLWVAKCAYLRTLSVEYVRDVARLISRERTSDAVLVIMNQIGPFDDQIKVWTNTIDGAYRHFPSQRVVHLAYPYEALWKWEYTVEYTGWEEEKLEGTSRSSIRREFYPELMFLEGLVYPLPGGVMTMRYLSLLGLIPDEIRAGVKGGVGVFIGDSEGCITSIYLHALQLSQYYYGIECPFTGERETHFSFVRPWTTSLSSQLTSKMMRNYRSVSQIINSAEDVELGENLLRFIPSGCSVFLYHFGEEWISFTDELQQQVAVRLGIIVRQLLTLSEGPKCLLIRFPTLNLTVLTGLEYVFKQYLPDQRLVRSLYTDPRSEEVFLLCTSLRRSSVQYYPDLRLLSHWVKNRKFNLVDPVETAHRARNATRAIFDRLSHTSSLRYLFPSEIAGILQSSKRIKPFIMAIHSYIRGKPINRHKRSQGNYNLELTEQIHWCNIVTAPLLLVLGCRQSSEWHRKLYALLKEKVIIIWDEDGWETGGIFSKSVNLVGEGPKYKSFTINPTEPRLLKYLMAAGRILLEYYGYLSFHSEILHIKDYYTNRDPGTYGYLRSQGDSLWYPRNWKLYEKEQEVVFIPKTLSPQKEESFGTVKLTRYDPIFDYPGCFGPVGHSDATVEGIREEGRVNEDAASASEDLMETKPMEGSADAWDGEFEWGLAGEERERLERRCGSAQVDTDSHYESEGGGAIEGHKRLQMELESLYGMGSWS